MNNYFKAIDSFAVDFARAAIRFRWLVLLAAILAAIGIGSGGKYLEFENNYRAFFFQRKPSVNRV